MHDLLIRGGRVVDGTGEPAFRGDVAIDEGQISAVGELSGEARETIDASGLLVTPGFVDIHTHYDGQVTWDPRLTPTCWHGVTTAVIGNCGVGFAPVAPDRHRWLIGLMEGVEDIPGTALHEGIRWGWETFPEYLDVLDALPLALDVGTQVPHGAVRAYVMGERGAENEPATADDIARMAEIVREGLAAGALGFSTSRTIAHRAIDGRNVPGTFAAEDELFGIGRAMPSGVFELAPAGVTGDDLALPEKEVDWMRRLSAEVGRPVTFALVQHATDPKHWKRILKLSAEAAREGAQLFPQAHGRSVGGLLGLEARHLFLGCPSFAPLRDLPLEEKVVRLRDPALRERLLEEAGAATGGFAAMMDFDTMFELSDPPDYEPPPEQSLRARARREGVSELGLMYDLMIQKGGRQLILVGFFNYADGNLDAAREMLEHPVSVIGLSDGGAHCGAICDASVPTFMLSHWARDRNRGTLPLEWVVRKQTADTARLFGLHDRGVIRPGFRADLNLIDFDELSLELPELVHDLPAGGSRFIQRARGYRATLVGGEVVSRDGEDTGARPGHLIRGEQAAPEVGA